MRPEAVLDRATVAGGLAAVRSALGVAALLAPRTVGRLLFHGGADARLPASTVTTLRMFGGRDLAMGVATLLARRRRSPALRGWLQAGALVDALDVAALLADRGRSLRPGVRWLAPVSAGGAATAGMVAAAQ